MIRLMMTIAAVALICGIASAEFFVGAQERDRSMGLVRNPHFEAGGHSYATAWRPLPGSFRMHRVIGEMGEAGLFLALREDGDGGVSQVITLPRNRRLSLRMLATCWTERDCSAVATLTRADGTVLAEVVVDGIKRGMLAESFNSGSGGPAELAVRVVGARGGRAIIDSVFIGPPLETASADRPRFTGLDLVLAPGAGLRVDADFRPRLLPQAARMLQEAMQDLSGRPISASESAVMVSVKQPQATNWPQREAYHLRVTEQGAQISAGAEQGAFWGMMTLLDLLRPEPDGGVRVVAVDVDDRPALPWRIAGAVSSTDPANEARRVARLKLNMAVVSYHQDDCAEVAAELQSVAVEPLVAINSDVVDDPRAAMEDAVSRLGARHLMVLPPSIPASDARETPPHEWDRPPLSAVADFARDSAGEVTVFVPAWRPVRVEHGGIDLDPQALVGVEGWPREIVALMPTGDPADMIQWSASGVRFVLIDAGGDDPSAVLQALRVQASHRCVGAFVQSRGAFGTMSLADSADLAWRGIRNEE